MPTLPTLHFTGINLWAVLVAAVVSMAIGAMWYSPSLFGKLWMELMGLNESKLHEMKQKGMAKKYFISLVSQLVAAYGFAVLMNTLSFFPTWADGVIFGFTLWLSLIATTSLSMVLWEGKPFKLYFLKTVHLLVVFLAMGTLLAVWR